MPQKNYVEFPSGDTTVGCHQISESIGCTIPLTGHHELKKYFLKLAHIIN